jgi:uncharacterized Zn-binding protein involved in type VI secretion
MTRPIAALGNPDSISFRSCCTYPPNVVTPIASTVFSNGRPRAKAGDVLTPAPGFPTCPDTSCAPLARAIIAPSKVFVNGRPSAHVGDLTNPASPRTILPSPTNLFVN